MTPHQLADYVVWFSLFVSAGANVWHLLRRNATSNDARPTSGELSVDPRVSLTGPTRRFTITPQPAVALAPMERVPTAETASVEAGRALYRDAVRRQGLDPDDRRGVRAWVAGKSRFESTA